MPKLIAVSGWSFFGLGILIGLGGLAADEPLPPSIAGAGMLLVGLGFLGAYRNFHIEPRPYEIAFRTAFGREHVLPYSDIASYQISYMNRREYLQIKSIHGVKLGLDIAIYDVSPLLRAIEHHKATGRWPGRGEVFIQGQPEGTLLSVDSATSAHQPGHGVNNPVMNPSADVRASGQPTGNPPVLGRRKVWFLRTVILGVVFLGLLLVGGPVSITAWDSSDSHRTSIACTVTEADGHYEHGSSKTPSYWGVTIKTSDCGQLLLIRGIDESNNQAVASELTPGARFNFEIGEGASSMRWLTVRLGMTTEVFSFEKID